LLAAFFSTLKEYCCLSKAVGAKRKRRNVLGHFDESGFAPAASGRYSQRCRSGLRPTLAKEDFSTSLLADRIKSLQTSAALTGTCDTIRLKA